MGKGSAPRPMEIDREQFGNRFDAIFGKPKEAEESQMLTKVAEIEAVAAKGNAAVSALKKKYGIG